MCLGIPMQVVEVKEGYARCTAQGVFREVSTLLLAERLAPGDFVMVHVGAALQKVDAAQAEAAWQTFSEIINFLEGKADNITLDFDTSALLQAPPSAPYTSVLETPAKSSGTSPEQPSVGS